MDGSQGQRPLGLVAKLEGRQQGQDTDVVSQPRPQCQANDLARETNGKKWKRQTLASGVLKNDLREN